MGFECGAAYLDEARRSLRGHKRLAEAAMAQLSDDELFRAIDAESNSAAVIVKHMAGNMRSRFSDFLTTDGEKPDRNRDGEFEMTAATARAEVMGWWDSGWQIVFSALDSLKPEDLGRTVTIRNEPHSVLQAINRQVAHYAYHVGQIVFLAKHLKGSAWQSLSIPRGQSQQFNATTVRERQTRP